MGGRRVRLVDDEEDRMCRQAGEPEQQAADPGRTTRVRLPGQLEGEGPEVAQAETDVGNAHWGGTRVRVLRRPLERSFYRPGH